METSAIVKNLNRRIIKNFLDILILAELQNGARSGYDIIAFVHDRFRVLMSSGTVYSLLYALERDGLITATWIERKRVYRLTSKGKETIQAIARANNEITYLASNLLRFKDAFSLPHPQDNAI
jgi:DNA-binding PadR family transcriptional regulator